MTPDHPLYTKVSQLWLDPQVQAVVGIIDAIRLELFRAQKLQEVKKYTIDDVRDTLLIFIDYIGGLDGKNLAAHMLITEFHINNLKEHLAEFRPLMTQELFGALVAYDDILKIEPAYYSDIIETSFASQNPCIATLHAGWTCEFLSDNRIDETQREPLDLDNHIKARGINICEFCDTLIRHRGWQLLPADAMPRIFDTLDHFSRRVRSKPLQTMIAEHIHRLKDALAAAPPEAAPMPLIQTRVKNAFKMKPV